MKSIQSVFQVSAVTMALACGVSQAQAALSPDVNYTIGIGPSITVGNNAITIDGKSEGNFYLGEITLTARQPSSFISPWAAVCVDVEGVVNIGQSYNFSQSSFTGNLTGLAPLWGRQVNGAFSQANASQAIENAADIFYSHRSAVGSGYTAAQWWAAMQLSVWEVLYDTDKTAGNSSFNLSSGRFTVNESAVGERVYDLAQSWLTTADVSYAGSLLIPVTQGANGWVADANVQEMLYAATPVPEPATLLAGALLLVPFGASTIRILRHAPRSK
jgi:hypothetical protein